MPKIATTDGLNVKQRKFAREYMLTGHGTNSAIKAGYSKNSARSTATALLRNPNVQRYLAARQVKEEEKAESTREKILKELGHLAFANIEDFTTLTEDGRRVIDYSRATREQLAALTKIKTKTRHVYTPKGEHIGTEHADEFNLADKYRGLELLGKTEGMFQEKEQRVVIDVADRLLLARRRLRQLEDGTYAQSDEDTE